MAIDPTGVIQLFLHPPLGLLRTERISGGPFTGLNSFNRPRLNTQTDAYGIQYLITSFPPGYGLIPGPGHNFFDRRVLSASITHRLIEGTFVTSQQETSNQSGGYFLFNESFPWNVVIELAPGVAAQFDWLLRLGP